MKPLLQGPTNKCIVKVLRLKVGDQIALFDTTSTEYYGKIRGIGKWGIFIEILQSKKVNTDSPIKITLLQGLPKGR